MPTMRFANRSVPIDGKRCHVRLFIHATNIHTGGGRTLLSALLKALPAGLKAQALLDRRMKVPPDISENIEIRTFDPNLLQRLGAEWWLARHVRAGDRVLCFGNLPPLFRVQGQVSVFLQNRYLVDPSPLAGFPLNVRLRLNIERAWLALAASHAQAFIVQTLSMKAALSSTKFAAHTPIHVWPFADAAATCNRKLTDRRPLTPPAASEAHFLYVASGDPHKNHTRLIEAWCLLAAEGLFPALHLTIAHQAVGLCQWIEGQKRLHGLKLVNHGLLAPSEVTALYQRATALVFPSTMESFGLPLIEARNAGLPILAPEADYVRDIIDPEESFDPLSPVSIMRAVKRFLGLDEPDLNLMSAEKFIAKLLEGPH